MESWIQGSERDTKIYACSEKAFSCIFSAKWWWVIQSLQYLHSRGNISECYSGFILKCQHVYMIKEFPFVIRKALMQKGVSCLGARSSRPLRSACVCFGGGEAGAPQGWGARGPPAPSYRPGTCFASSSLAVPGVMNLFTSQKTPFQLGQLLRSSRKILWVSDLSESQTTVHSGPLGPWRRSPGRRSSVIPTRPSRRLPSGAQLTGRGWHAGSVTPSSTPWSPVWMRSLKKGLGRVWRSQ